MTLTAKDLAALHALVTRYEDGEKGAVAYTDLPKQIRVDLMGASYRIGKILEGIQVPTEL